MEFDLPNRTLSYIINGYCNSSAVLCRKPNVSDIRLYKTREMDLKIAARAWNVLYENFVYAGDDEALTNALNRYADKNTACCFLFDDQYKVILTSENTAELKASYIKKHPEASADK